MKIKYKIKQSSFDVDYEDWKVGDEVVFISAENSKNYGSDAWACKELTKPSYIITEILHSKMSKTERKLYENVPGYAIVIHLDDPQVERGFSAGSFKRVRRSD